MTGRRAPASRPMDPIPTAPLDDAVRLSDTCRVFILLAIAACSRAVNAVPAPLDAAEEGRSSDGLSENVAASDAASSGGDRAVTDAGASPLDVRTIDSSESSDATLSDGRTYGPDGAPCIFRDTGVQICCGLPGELPGGNCLLGYTLAHNADTCIAVGGGFDLKDTSLGAHCCAGLVSRAPSSLLENGICAAPPVSAAVCLPCGDGVCQKIEDRCSCPADCR